MLQGIIEHDDGFICSRRNRWHLQHWSPTELGKETRSPDPNALLKDQGGSLGLVLLPLWDQQHALQVSNLANKPTGTKRAQWVELLLLQLAL